MPKGNLILMNDFKEISIDHFVKKTKKANPNLDEGELRNQLNAFRKEKGELCACGEPIWIVGSAMTGRACFTCITGETDTSGDYEIG